VLSAMMRLQVRRGQTTALRPWNSRSRSSFATHSTEKIKGTEGQPSFLTSSKDVCKESRDCTAPALTRYGTTGCRP
jgi:hypothetical protein